MGRLRDSRERAGLTVEDAARMSGIEPDRLRVMEDDGAVELPWAWTLAYVYGTLPSYLRGLYPQAVENVVSRFVARPVEPV